MHKLAALMGAILGISAATALAGTLQPVSPVVEPLLTFHPGWVTRSVTSHDPWGHNGDGAGNGIPSEGDYRVLFHGRGEGRILRIWMTANLEHQVPTDYQELWIILDGQTAFRGKPTDFFDGQGPWKSPLVLGYQEGSGGFSSYVPFPYSREAKILFKGDPHYFQVTYREGAGSSAGPSAEQLESFMTEAWDTKLPPPARKITVTPRAYATVMIGPALVSGLALKVDPAKLGTLQIHIGNQPAVPASFFFGLASTGKEADGGMAKFRSALDAADPDTGVFATRLPIPLQTGEALRIECTDMAGAQIAYSLTTAAAKPGVHLDAQYREQQGPGTETTMPFYESASPTQFVSLIEEITDGQPGSRGYLEGDEMIRTDQMQYPLQLGTGTEDYFNGGWYFLGAFANPFSGQPRFNVIHPEDGWSHATFEHSLYRLHLADPIVGRQGMRFGFEAGEVGAYTPIRYRTLGLAYRFDQPQWVATSSADVARGESLTSSFDAEHSAPLQVVREATTTRVSSQRFVCPAGPHPDGVFLTRTYDAAQSGQFARVRVNGRDAGTLFEAYANPGRRLAQDALWVDLATTDCPADHSSAYLDVDFDASESPAPWTEIRYDALFWSGTAAPSPAITQGPAVKIFDSGTHYVNDHTFVQDASGAWHLYGIYHPEPFNSGEEEQFVHASSPVGAIADWAARGAQTFSYAPEPIALEADASRGETHIWAPHVVRDGDRYVMAFQAGGPDNDHARIQLATSTDLAHWERLPAPAFTDVCVARDPMLRKVAGTWVMYYTRCDSTESHRSGVAYRTSQDLVHWSEPSMALVLADTPPMFNSGYTESPFVFERGGWFYLSVTSYPVDWAATFLYRSRTPFHFEPVAIARLTAHAGEWLSEDFDSAPLYLSHAGAGQGGVWLSAVQF